MLKTTLSSCDSCNRINSNVSGAKKGNYLCTLYSSIQYLFLFFVNLQFYTDIVQLVMRNAEYFCEFC